MELNRDQIIKDLECCKFGKDEAKCKECNWHPWIKPRCWRLLASNSLALIEELAAEVEVLKAERDNYKEWYFQTVDETKRLKMNKGQINKALECCTRGRKSKDDRPCLDCPYNECNIVGGTSERQTTGTCQGWLMKDALALIKKLSEENEAWQKQLISKEEKMGKDYYELACEVENLRSENERLRADKETLYAAKFPPTHEDWAKLYRMIIAKTEADTVRQMQERLTTFFAADDTLKYSEVEAEYINSQIDKIAKELEKKIVMNNLEHNTQE